MNQLTSYILLILTITTFVNADLSHLVTRKCSPDGSKQSEECYINLINSLIKTVSLGKTGDVEISNLDPLDIKGQLNLSVNAGADQYHMNFIEPRFLGFSKAKVTNIKPGNPLQVSLYVPRLEMKSAYKNSGRLILITASGGGVMTNTFDECNIKLKIGYRTTQNNGKTYGTITNFNFDFMPKKSNMHVEKLNSGNAIAKELYNVFLSASSSEILDLMKPQMNSQFGSLFRSTTEQVLKDLPYDAMFE